MLFSPDCNGKLFLLLPEVTRRQQKKNLEWKAGKWIADKKLTIRSFKKDMSI
ncbi:hypothetical protein [Flavobacterium sp.]|uniref:hypothetical protein n=1 Tax=Flavobacterium sp. TaxID=239 RepID=UPI0026050EE8|nr:hypothetical protein [Flavobacterium sp.]